MVYCWLCVCGPVLGECHTPQATPVRTDSKQRRKYEESARRYSLHQTVPAGPFSVGKPLQKKTVEVIRRLVASIPDYLLVIFVVNSQTAGVLCSRPRMYAVGINLQLRVALLPVELWGDKLRAICESMRAQAPPLQAYLLPTSSDMVQDCLESLRARHAKATKLASSPKWKLERKKHMLIRDTILNMFHLKLPSPEARAALPDGSTSECLELLPLRMRDVVYLHTAAAWHLLGVNPAEHKLSWDLARSVGYSRKKHPTCAGLVPCLTRTHYVWCAAVQRILSGSEHLSLQGLDMDNVIVRGVPGGAVEEIHISDTELRHLAGNTMSVPVVAAIMGLVKILTPHADEWTHGWTVKDYPGHGSVLFVGEHREGAAKLSGLTTCIDVLPTSLENDIEGEELGLGEELHGRKRYRRLFEKTHVSPVQAPWPFSPTGEELGDGEDLQGRKRFGRLFKKARMSPVQAPWPLSPTGEELGDGEHLQGGKMPTHTLQQSSRIPVQASWPISPTTVAGPLLPHQEHVMRTLHPSSETLKLLIDHPTGSGKTRTIIEVLSNFFQDRRAKLVVFPTTSICRNFYMELIRWPNPYRDYFASSRPHDAELACGGQAWSSARDREWELRLLTKVDASRLCASIREVLDMKGLFRNGKMHDQVSATMANGAAVRMPAAPLRAFNYKCAGGALCDISEDNSRVSAIMKFGLPSSSSNVYDNKIVVLDEAHNLLIQGDARLDRLRQL